MAGNNPTAAFVLSLIGGLIILIEAVILLAFASILEGVIGGLTGVGGLTSILTAIFALGAIFGLVVILGGVMLYAKPQSHVMWGVIVLLFSLFSIIAGGGFYLGLILGLVGGILGIIWKPSMPMPAPMMQQPMPPQ